MTHAEFLKKLKTLFDNKPKGVSLCFMVSYINEKGDPKELIATQGNRIDVVSCIINFFKKHPEMEHAVAEERCIELLEEAAAQKTPPINNIPC